MKNKMLIHAIRLLFLGLFIIIMTRGAPVLWLGLFGLSLIAAVFFGRIFCGWICPMNTLMAVTDRFRQRLGRSGREAPALLQSGWLRWAVLIGSVLVMVAAKRVLHRDIPVLIFLLILSVIMTFRYKPEVFHNKVCPFGIFQGLTGQFAVYSRGVEARTCIGCAKCKGVCPSEAIVVQQKTGKAAIDPKLCHQCTNCTLVCPTQAIRYDRKRMFISSVTSEDIVQQR